MDEGDRREEILRLPVTTLWRRGDLAPPGDGEWADQPQTVGIGPDGQALAAWTGRSGHLLVTGHRAGPGLVFATELSGAMPAPRFIQPLPDGRVLLVGAGDSGPAAQVWSAEGRLITDGDLGNAVAEVLTTAGGAIWVGYSDRAFSGPETHGLVRYTGDLTVDWLYPQQAPLPTIWSSYALNVNGETAYSCAYADFHLVSIDGTAVVDHGPAPVRGARQVLIGNGVAAFVGGYGAEHDLVTRVGIRAGGIEPSGDQRRIVRPDDGAEVGPARYTGRGAELHLTAGRRWYRTTLDASGPTTVTPNA